MSGDSLMVIGCSGSLCVLRLVQKRFVLREFTKCGTCVDCKWKNAVSLWAIPTCAVQCDVVWHCVLFMCAVLIGILYLVGASPLV